MTEQKKMTTYLLAFIKGLKDSGMKKIVISPGSRSTPLALLIHRDPEVKTYVNVDERSAAFFALGLAKSTLEPVGILCTSGTAAANFYPAICEAKEANIPLVILTADRPPEARGVGAPQTMDQQKLYSNHVKNYTEMALPEDSKEFLRYSYWHGANSAATSVATPAGPVHVNLPFREPLIPDLSLAVEFSFYARHFSSKKIVEEVPELPEWMSKKGLIIIGRALSSDQARKLIDLAEYLKWPIIGDPLSNLATCKKTSRNYIPHADLIFSQKLPESPEVIWQFGNLPVAKNVMIYIKKYLNTNIEYVVIDEREEWQDFLHLGTSFLPMDIQVFCELVQTQGEAHGFSAKNTLWLSHWQKAHQLAQAIIKEELTKKGFSESQASSQLLQLMHPNEVLFLSNSNAIRLVDRLAYPVKKEIDVMGNRGVNGIDGILSTAAGISATKRERTFVLIGDLALFHDMNALQQIKMLELPITLIVLNNNGGGIFSFLPQKELEKEDFEPLFATPIHLDLEKVASLYDGLYFQPKTVQEWEKAIHQSRKQTNWSLIEIKGKQNDPVELWQNIINQYGEEHV
ncbi:2-succinyl-5-enolpyruvyl-6-hydroxy-3-cyclohexene-1-carboxylic-acid synthase [Enterococcus sp. 10A9_DIV0425]|uniref:2-succinyl-5-enolpyruvyl-6-hydroxy-3-cyclohexene-1-carboxylate synthase n=1 Tax=Candidatus Enterococcus wittei TaxID=1987383 RepID=A0A2C9XPU6_9ENTE|nr:2-succinyl-5-enolpyruvyl-6-hydroxy-3-cyclohexene-1-carboxylic-acid synthase [Enterococcus sp. 10A9_DIV0425]OTP11868.1 2-succinyl-5-enolpyruvyl-6-hydroxy-3-cyclohexene-1-carboxylic-acid synthase [Enterococcus sp. 10A9_DIV0425]